MCDIAPATMRVALSRLVAAGELTMSDGVYVLSPRHLDRLRAQHEDIAPALRPWHGDWETVIVVESGRDAADRARLRASLSSAHLAELREGVWMRPANLDRPILADPHTTSLLAKSADPQGLVAALWDLDAWARTAREIVDAVSRPGLDARRFAAATQLVRHLRTDPALPDELTPSNWPAADLRAAYADYQAQLRTHHVRREGVLT
jgi:phenylacetic acid degradation operon negative regulatory protein